MKVEFLRLKRNNYFSVPKWNVELDYLFLTHQTNIHSLRFDQVGWHSGIVLDVYSADLRWDISYSDIDFFFFFFLFCDFPLCPQARAMIGPQLGHNCLL
jgi:hypothetical protein